MSVGSDIILLLFSVNRTRSTEYSTKINNLQSKKSTSLCKRAR